MDHAGQVSDSETSFSPTPPHSARPNRWTGPPSTYLSLTEQERGLAASLNQIRDQDLSIHLYNAHALKRRARLFWERKGKGEEFDEEGEGMGWAPGKGWTAWPLPSDEVPRDGEIVGEDDGSDVFTLRRRIGVEEGPSRMLEDIMVGTTLRFARERFEGREWVDSDEEIEDGSIHGDFGIKTGTEDPDNVDAGDHEQMEEDYLPSGQGDALDGEENDPEFLIKKQSEPPESRTWLRSVISVDDERSATLLRPSIRHTFAKLDEVLVALHYAREACHQYGSRSAANTDDETVRSEDSDSPATPTKRPRGRPRKFANLALLPKGGGSGLTLESNDADLFRAKKTHLGRPQKVYERLQGENQQEYLIRIARLQKKPMPSFAVPQPPSVSLRRSHSAASERSRKSSARRATSEELKTSRQKKLGLRNWSEVLGSAALVGFPPDVIARATQRCADLFGEGMTMMTLPEVPRTEKDAFFTTTYQPEEIPAFGSENDSSDEESDGEEIKISRSTSRSRKLKAPTKITTRSWFCPIEECRRENRGFRYISGLRRHMSMFHVMKEDAIDELLDNDQEMEGAVHIDGFLKPMRQKRGMRGTDKEPRKKRGRTKKDDSTDDLEDDGEAQSNGSLSSVSDNGEGGGEGGEEGDTEES